MKRTAKKAKPVARSTVVRGFDISTAEGSKAWERDHKRRKRIAEEFFRTEFLEITDSLNEIDNKITSVLADLSHRNDMWETVAEVARLASAAYSIRTAIPTAKTEEASS